MSKDDMNQDEMTSLESRLITAEADSEEESLGRVMRRVRAHVNTNAARVSPRRSFGQPR